MDKWTKQVDSWIFFFFIYISVVVDFHCVVTLEAWVIVSFLQQAISPSICLYYCKKLAH